MTTTAVILAGTHGWRDELLDALCPRLLWPIANRPVGQIVLEWLAAGGIQQAVVCAHDDLQTARAELGDGAAHGLDLHYYEDRLPRGPAGCVRDAADLVGADCCVALEGSILPGTNLREVLAAHARTGAWLTVVVARAESGPAEDSAEVPVGIYVFAREALDEIPLLGYRDIKELLIPALYRAQRPVMTYVVPTRHDCLRVRGFDDYLTAQGWLLERLRHSLGAWAAEYGLERDNLIHRRARVDTGARVIGPVMVGADARLEGGAVVIGPSVIGAGAVVGSGSVVSRSVLWENCILTGNVRLDRCLVTSDGRLASGTTAIGEICCT